MNDNLLSGLFYFLEFLNPPPPLELAPSDIQNFMIVGVMLVMGSLLYSLLKATELPQASAITIATCIAMMGGISLHEYDLTRVAAQYAIAARTVDGLLFGFAVGELIRSLKDRLGSFAPFYLLGESLWTIISWGSVFLIGRSCFLLFQMDSFIRRTPALAISMVFLCVSGLLAAPFLESSAFQRLFLIAFPASSILGLAIGLIYSREQVADFLATD